MVEEGKWSEGRPDLPGLLNKSSDSVVVAVVVVRHVGVLVRLPPVSNKTRHSVDLFCGTVEIAVLAVNASNELEGLHNGTFASALNETLCEGLAWSHGDDSYRSHKIARKPF